MLSAVRNTMSAKQLSRSLNYYYSFYLEIFNYLLLHLRSCGTEKSDLLYLLNRRSHAFVHVLSPVSSDNNKNSNLALVT